MATIVVGTALIYGVADDVTAMAVQSYSCDSSFVSDVTAQDKDGLTITQRLDDRTSDLTVEGILKSSSIPSLGDTITFTLNSASSYPGPTATATFVGTILKVSEKGTVKGFSTVSITAKTFENA